MTFLLICVLSLFVYEVRSEAMVETVCVDMYKQPSLDHPSLSNHKIQLKPTFPDVPSTGPSTGTPYSFTDTTITCPEGMVPIQRLGGGKNISDINQIMQAQNKYMSNANIQTNALPVAYRGASAEIRVQNPPTQGDQFSSGLIRVLNNYDSNEIISAGWAASPGIFGDTKTHLYGSFQVGGNIFCVGTINCKGFVQIDRNVYIGLPFPDIVSDLKKQITLEVKISKDQGTSNWWLIVVGGRGEIKVGYWPKELFESLTNNIGALMLEYGGYATSSSSSGMSPPMGTGNRAGLDLSAAAYFAHVKFININGQVLDFNDPKPRVILSSRNCYDLIDWGLVNSNLGYIFTYGGPGGRCDI